MGATESGNVIEKLVEELSRLFDYVEKTKSGIQDIEKTVKAGCDTVPQVSVQLNTVTGDLEEAANTIMTILEDVLAEHEKSRALLDSLSSWAAGLGTKEREEGEAIITVISSINERTEKMMMEIFSNMSFHDLSGQKLRKATTSLSVVQSKLNDIAKSIGIKSLETDGCQAAPPRSNGIVDDPMDQDVVDRLLKKHGV